MIIAALWLAGASFVLTVIVGCIAVAEHYRAERVEKALLAQIDDQRRQYVAVVDTLRDLALEVRAQDQMIRAVAAASTPPILNSGTPYIVLPGPRTAQ